MSNTLKPCPYELWDEEIVYPGKWLKVRKVNFRLKSNGEEGTWESAHRSTMPESKDVDCIGIIAKLKKEGKEYFILVKQYRIPTRCWSIEIPAGHIDKNDSTIEEAGIRELKEETGYTVTKVLGWSHGKQFLGTGICDESFRYIFVEIDGDAEMNINPKQQLDHSEHVEVILVECDKLLDYLDEVSKSDDIDVIGYLYTFAVGYCMKSKFG